MTRAVENICQEVSLVNKLLTLYIPNHFSLALHLSVDKVANVVATIRPLEFTVALYLAVFQLAAIHEHLFDLLLIIRVEVGLLVVDVFPLFYSFAVY